MGIVKVDIGPLIGAVLKTLPTEDDRVRILRGVAASARSMWISLAQSRLHSTSRDYIQGIQEDISDSHATISLEGMLPNMIEQGWVGGDLRQWLLHGKAAKIGKKGPYAVIPFAHGSSKSGGRNVGNPMPPDIHRAAKKLAPTLSRPGKIESKPGKGTVVYGQRLSPLSKNVNEVARKLLNTKSRPWHASSIYTGMIREGKQFASGKTQTTGYKSFRTVSMNDRAPGKHWFHPGLKARHLAKEVQSKVETLAKDIITGALRDRTPPGRIGGR
jgi:hypothetical protein